MEPNASPRRRKKAPRPPLDVEVDLVDWGARGATVANLDGRRVAVDRGIPGEHVQALIDRRRQPWRGVVRDVIGASPTRVAPSCPYYLAGCGGCQWQHMAYQAQLATKRALIERDLRAAGLDYCVDTMHGMDDPWRYRHTASIALGWEAGFRPRGRRGIVEIHDCPISHPLIGALADRANALLKAGDLPGYHGKLWLDCTVVGPRVDPSLQVLIQGIEGLTLESHPELPAVAATLATLSEVSSVAFRHRSGEPIALVGDLMSQIEIGGELMWLTAGSFSQANLTMLDRVLARVREILSRRLFAHAADVYGGSGTFALNLADLVGRMTLIELDALAVAAAQRTAEDRGLLDFVCVSSHAERALSALDDVDLVIVDPPRSGLGVTVTDAIGACRPSMVFYVSCAPASLARDLAALANLGYRPRFIEGFDFYPQTYHVESLTVLER
jgi:23S rRNA (uracil1939-C5)-methyltransferase